MLVSHVVLEPWFGYRSSLYLPLMMVIVWLAYEAIQTVSSNWCRQSRLIVVSKAIVRCRVGCNVWRHYAPRSRKDQRHDHEWGVWEFEVEIGKIPMSPNSPSTWGVCVVREVHGTTTCLVCNNSLDWRMTDVIPSRCSSRLHWRGVSGKRKSSPHKSRQKTKNHYQCSRRVRPSGGMWI